MRRTVILAALAAGLGMRGQTAGDPLAQAEVLIGREEFVKAEEMLLGVDSKNMEARYRLGYVQFRQRKLVAAKESFLAVVGAAPPAYYSRYFLGRISLLEGKAADAARWLEPVAASKEPVFDAEAQLSGAYAQMGQLPKAAAALQAAIARSPWDGGLYFRLGQLQQRMGLPGPAKESFATSNRLKSADRADVERLMAVSAALRKGEFDAAFAAARGVEERQPADPGALVALGILFGGAGLDPHALSAFEAAVKLDPNLFEAHLNRGLAYLKRGNLGAAIEALTAAGGLLPQSVEASRSLGLALVMSQRYGDAQAPLEKAFRADPSQRRLGLMLATAYLRTDATAKALPLLRGLAADPAADPAAMLLLIDAQTAANDLPGALETARAARRRFPNAAEPAMAEAQQLVRQGQYQNARPVWEAALRLKPDALEAELGLADCLQKAGEHGEALTHYRTAARGRETELGAKVGMARSMVALRQFEEARVVLEGVLGGNPNSIAARQELSRVYARLGKSELAAEQARLVDQLRAANTP